jgi:hypothetical protein
MDAKTKKYLIVGGAIVLGLYGYRVLMRKLNKPTEEQMSMLDKDLVLEKGSQGSEVAELQRRLKEDFGKYLGETGIDNDGIDGDFGSLTETALFEAKGVKSITLNKF